MNIFLACLCSSHLLTSVLVDLMYLFLKVAASFSLLNVHGKSLILRSVVSK